MKTIKIALLLFVSVVFSAVASAQTQDPAKDISLYSILGDWKVVTTPFSTTAADKTVTGASVAGLGNTYVLQINAKQSTDRTDLISGNVANNIAQTQGFSLFFRGNDYTGTNEIGFYAKGKESMLIPAKTQVSPQKKGDSAIYGVVYNNALDQAKVYIGVCDAEGNVTSQKYIASINAAFFGTTVDSTNLGAGNYKEASGISTFKVGNAVKCVTVGNSSLIDTLQYSDTFNMADRIANKGYVTTGPYTRGQAYYDVENCYGNSQVQWVGAGVFSIPNGDNYDVGGTGYSKASSGAGSLDGFTQTGLIYSSLDNCIEYNNLSDQFTVQLDAIQTTDRVCLNVGPATSATGQGTTGFSVFFRKDGGTANPEFGLYYNGTEYNLTDSTKAWGTIKSVAANSGLISVNEWNNYGIRVDSVNMELELYSGEWSLGTVDLTTFSGFTTLDAKYVGYSITGGARAWSDNFQVGTTAMNGVSVGKSTILPSEPIKSESFRSGSALANQWYDNGVALSAFTLKKDSDNVFNTGSSAGSATGAALGGSNHQYSIKTEAMEDIDFIAVQMDAILPSDHIGLLFSENPATLANSVQFFFRSDASSNQFGLYAGSKEYDISGLISNEESMIVGNWYNFGVLYDVGANTASLYLNENLMGKVDLAAYLPGGIDFDYAGFRVYGTGGIYVDNFQIGYGKTTSEVPEPSSLALALLGFVGLILMAGKRRGK